MYNEKKRLIVCPFCGKESKNPIYRSSVTEEQRKRYLAEEGFVHEIFEDSLTDEAKELLIAGTCYDCQDRYFSWRSTEEVPEKLREEILV